MIKPRHALILLLLLCLPGAGARAQVECSGWGELRGIRIDGQLMPVTAGIVVAGPDWKQVAQTAHWRTRNPKYARDGNSIVCTGQLGFGFRGPALSYRQTVTDAGAGQATVDSQVTADGDMDLNGVYVMVSVPGSEFGAGTGQLIGVAAPADAKVSFATTKPANARHYIDGHASGAQFGCPHYQVEVTFDETRDATLQDDRDAGQNQLSLLFPIQRGNLKRGQMIHATYTIKVTGHADTSPVTVQIDTSRRGAAFAGFGGNFVWGTQSPTVEFYLDNLRVSWARVGMDLPQWQPEENSDPTTRPVDQLPDGLRESLRMATELHRRGIPMIATVWTAPAWAMAARPPGAPAGPGFGRASRRVNPAKWDELAKCIGSYLLYFKKVVGAEPELFSFNESNMGINVLLSPTEHRDAIKRLGAYFQSVGLKTKLLLGDANEPRPVEFPDATLADPEAMKYVGAISYHSWNGGTDAQLIGWHDRAARANLPLIIAEAGTDPDAYRYPLIFNEPWYAVDEAVMYLRSLTLSQPMAMLHWQLTPDYGFIRPTTGPGGTPTTEPADAKALTMGTDMPLSQRWQQYKQLDTLTPADAAVLPVTCDSAAITVAVLAAPGKSLSVIHLVNTGGARPVTIAGLPAAVTHLDCRVTDVGRGMQETDPVTVSNGTAQVNVPAQSLVTLTVQGD